MKQSLSWSTRLMPILVVQGFLWGTFGLFEYGPWHWPLSNPGSLAMFVVCAHGALFVGYLTAAHHAPRHTPPQVDWRRLLQIGLWATVLVLPITPYARTGHWVPNLGEALRNPGAVYEEAHEYASTATNFASYLRILTAPALALVFPLGIYHWSQLNRETRLLLIGAVLGVVVMMVATGQRRDIADLLVTVPFILAASHVAGVTRMKRRAIAIGVSGACLVTVAFAGYFMYSHISRVGAETAEYGVNPVTHQQPDMDNPVLTAFPAEMRPGVVAGLNYLTTGYYGLALTLRRPVEPMYGVGHSMFLTRNFAKLTHETDFEQRSLPVQISERDGYRYPVYWCTAYPYFANDLGFVGTILLLFLIGRGLASTWIDMLGGRNPYAVVFFSLLTVLIFYLPATNRALQDGEGVLAFYVWLATWAWSRKAWSPSTVPQGVLA